MKNRRLLAMLLVFCMVFSNLAMGASAVEAPADSAMNAEAETEETVAATESAVSPFANENVISGEDTTEEEQVVKTLRDDDVVVKSEIAESTGTAAEGSWEFAPVDAPETSLPLAETPECLEELKKAAELFAADETVRAFVVMEEAPLADSYTSKTLASASVEKQMLQKQDSVIAAIERTVLGGEKLNVRYQFTYLTNAFSIETAFVNLEKIAVLDGVKSVFVMPVYNAVPTDESAVSPNTASASEMTGAAQVWEELGYTGVGMKIAVIDTGLDLDHPSFAAEPETNEDSLTVADIDAALEDLNAYSRRSTITGKTLYRSAKVPYAFNYCDNNLVADHSSDYQGDHGTHVSGIAAANEVEGTSVKGMAPDAQIIVMKVFGAAGGAYTDDIVAALEDAMTLGCDVVNASLGSPAGFSSTDTEIDLIYQRLASQDIVACISAGNEGTSSYGNMWGTDMNRTANPDNATIGQPGIYSNVMTIASADNAVVMNSYFTLADGKDIFYMDPYQYYYAMTDLVDPEYWGYTDPIEYVVIDGLGEEADFYDEEGNSLVEGKIAIIKRGTISFASKIFNAEYAGAVAAIIWDNVSEDIFNFGMQISEDGETYPTIPACLVSLEDGEVMAAAEPKTLLVSSELGQRENATGGQISSFSSWGVSPELGLEPDITGIGGNVYSCYDGGTYGLMSGTSMSSPQVAGVTALVMQRLKELYPNAPDGTVRELAEAMLMSTADPIIDSTFGTFEASPRQQGAGLVNAYEATTTEVYLTVGGEKPKAELGDSSTGNYTFSFEIHNIGDEDVTYTLDYSLLTEYAAGMQLSATEVEYFMYGVDIPLSGSVSFNKNTVTVPAGGNANVTATIQLSADDKAYFEQCWENGGYVEGFVYLTSADAEGAVTSELNLPFLGFYGDWTEAPVFDTAYWYDNSFWGVNPADGLPEGDEYYTVMWTDLAGSDWVLGFNPYSGAYTDANGNIAYDPAHNVISPNGDGILDGLTEIYLSLMRNAKSLTFTYTVDGEIVHRETVTNNSKTMYRSSYGQVVPWLYSWYGNGMYDFTDENGNTLPSGTEVMLTIDAKVDYGIGGDHTIEIPLYVDTTAPELLDFVAAELEDGTDVLGVQVSDETALAAVYIMNPAGTQFYAQAYDVQMTQDGDSYIAYFDISQLGTEFLVAVCDYAANEAYFQVTYNAADGNLPAMDDTQLYAYRVFDDAIYSDHMYGWVSLNKPAADENANLSVWTDDYMEYAAINAAEYVDGKIFAVDAVYNLVVMDPGLFNRTTVCNLGVNVIDMTFDDSTDTMYVLSKHENYTALYTMDLLTGELTLVKDFGYYYYAPYGLADDDNGTLYVIKYAGSNLYTLDAENDYAMTAITDADGNAIVIYDSNGAKVNPQYAQGMTIEDGKLYWAYYKYLWYGGSSELITIDLETMTTQGNAYAAMAYDADYNLVQYNPVTELVGLLTLTDTEYTIPEATELTDVVLSSESLILTIGDVANVTASPLPWNYELGEVTWTSSNESVATVVGGRITGMGEGKATITVTAEGISKTIDVTVVKVDGNFYAYNYYSADGYYGYMIDVDLATMNYTLVDEAPADFLAGEYNGHDGCFYGYTEGGQFWKYDMETGTAVKLGSPIGSVPADMAYDYTTGLMYAVTADYNNYCGNLYTVDLMSGKLELVYSMSNIFMMTLAIDLEGNFYTITADGMLVKLSYVYDDWFEEYSWMPEVLLENLGYLQYAQSMCYDFNNDVILWTNPETASVYWIDVNDAFMISLGDPTESGTIEFIGMYTVPAEIPALADVAVANVAASDMLMLTGSKKAPDVTINPFNATCKSIAWTSSDESVVAVTSDGMFNALSEGVATMSGTLTDTVSGESFAVTMQVTVLPAADDLYGHMMTDIATYGGQYWIRMYPTDPSSPDNLNTTAYVIYAEEYYDGNLYAFGYDPNDWSGNWQFFVMDPTSYAIKEQHAMGDAFPFVYDMTYDYTTSTMYCVAGAGSTASDLYAVNLENGELVLLKSTDQFFMSLAAGPDGNLYAMEQSAEEYDPDTWSSTLGNAQLYKIDPTTLTVEWFADTGIQSNMLSSMSYDYDTDYIYWTALAQGASYTGGLCLIDPETGAATNLGSIGLAGAQVAGLYIISENFPEEAEPALHALTLDTYKTVVTAGNTVTVNATVLPMTLDAQITWSSDDMSVATVENGVITGVSQGSTTVTATATYNDVTMTAECAVAVLNADAAFLAWNETDMGWSTISRADYTVVTNLTEGEEVNVSAAASVDEKVYGYDANGQLFQLNTADYTRTAVGTPVVETLIADFIANNGLNAEEYPNDLFKVEIRDMEYDVANNRMLILTGILLYQEWWEGYGEFSEVNSGTSVYSVDLTTGELTELYVFDEVTYVYSLAADEKGNVFFYTTFNDGIYKLDLANASYVQIVTLQTQSLYGEYGDGIHHAMYYDALTDMLYMAFTSNGNYYRMIMCDPNTGALTAIDEEGGQLYIGTVTYANWAYNGDKFNTLTFAADVDFQVCYANGISLDKTEMEVIENTTSELTATVVPTGAVNKTVTWTSSDDSVATVDENGVVTGVAVGTATITAACGDKEATCTVTVVACEHEWSDATCTAPKTCSICGATEGEPAEHEWTDATCTAPKTCSICGETEGEPLGHTEETIPGKEATCTETGLTEGVKCSVCGEILVAQEETPMTAHTYEDGVCTVCGAIESGVVRISGKDRFETAFAIADELKAVLGVEKFDAVIVAYSNNFPDALTGSYLAYVKNAPILLVNDNVIAQVQAYINENLAENGTVYILGGTAAVSEAFENAVKADHTVERLKGASRYLTNLAILEEAGVAADQEILVCTGANYADSLSAAATGLPMLLVDKALTAEQKAFLEGHTGSFTIIGGTGAVSEAVEAELQAYGTVERVKGASRYETSVLVAERYFSAPETVVLAYAENFPDGLCAGALAAAMKAPMVLTKSAKAEAADTYVEGISSGLVIGGTALISDEAAREIFDLPSNVLIVKK